MYSKISLSPRIRDSLYPSPRDARLIISLSSRIAAVYIPLSGIRVSEIQSLYPSPLDVSRGEGYDCLFPSLRDTRRFISLSPGYTTVKLSLSRREGYKPPRLYRSLRDIHDGLYPTLRDTRRFISLSPRYTTVSIPLSEIHDR